MKQSIIYALDFDGVICDSAVETAMTGWKSAMQIWPDMAGTEPSAVQIDQFRALRPVLETGYEAILLMRLLQQGVTLEAIKADNLAMVQALLSELQQDVAFLKQLFGTARDKWIAQARDEWVAMNPLFDGVAEKLRQLNGQDWYIVTTKQERFVEQILQANNVALPNDIFGLDRKMSKETVLQVLIEKYQARALCFIEDRLPTLLNVMQNERLKSVALQLVDWGYNTDLDKQVAREKQIQLISLHEFLVV
ncbi:MAG: HAD family hydrolase [Methyloprofundus sp.]|nr:HAD family hydrolase [Methyloprofundus sp.]